MGRTTRAGRKKGADRAPKPQDRYGSILFGAALVIVTVMVYGPVAGNAFIDLDDDGIELTEFDPETTTTFFDVDGDGFAEQTAWITADNDGLLARDVNENGVIDDVSELFGSPNVDGFALLALLDSNGDHVIDQYDDAWDSLLIWKDVNGDAVSQAGELFALGDFDIVSISLVLSEVVGQ